MFSHRARFDPVLSSETAEYGTSVALLIRFDRASHGGATRSTRRKGFASHRCPPGFPRKAAVLAEYFAGGKVMQVVTAERASLTRERQDLCALAQQYLERHPHFRGRGNGVKIKQEGRNLLLTGCLPSFYLKQMVQEAVRHVPGVQNVFNQIDVISASGVSSVRN
jgi:osmotically-inducible protein OsmY